MISFPEPWHFRNAGVLWHYVFVEFAPLAWFNASFPEPYSASDRPAFHN
ncbi:hypothetical protein CKA32_004399 [Geitlerinema sp. FC II]|nr:hypothetical protein CKA32_004399 [Geitlerinema sp. FC II]